MSISRVSAKGAVVIPVYIRKKLGIKAGMEVNIISVNDTIKIIPLPKDPIKSLRGSLKFDKTAEEMKTEMREEENRHETRRLERLRNG